MSLCQASAHCKIFPTAASSRVWTFSQFQCGNSFSQTYYTSSAWYYPLLYQLPPYIRLSYPSKHKHITYSYSPVRTLTHRFHPYQYSYLHVLYTSLAFILDQDQILTPLVASITFSTLITYFLSSVTLLNSLTSTHRLSCSSLKHPSLNYTGKLLAYMLSALISSSCRYFAMPLTSLKP